MDERQSLHTLVDDLPEPELLPARRFLEYLRQKGDDPLRSFLDRAPVDDEPVTSEDRAAIQEGFAQRAAGETISHEEAQRLLNREG